MKECLTVKNEKQENRIHPLDEVLRQGAQKLLMQAIEQEVRDYIEQFDGQRDAGGRHLIVRNGYLPRRNILTGLGSVEVQQPRVKDMREGQRFSSAILPSYARKAPSLEAVIPTLYLKGISTGDFSEALEALIGPGAKGLSATTIVRLKQIWQEEFKEWQRRDLSGKRCVYLWADGIYFNVRLTDDRPCILVLIGCMEDGTKELLAVHDGHRESTLSWKEVLQSLKSRGLTLPKLAIGDGALGFWSALEEEFPSTQHQRCWVHKTANILDKMPKRVQPSAKEKIHDMYMAETKKEAERSFDEFLVLYEAKYPKACKCLKKDRDQLFSFYDFPAMHWQHIRSTNVIESAFATVRHRTRQTKGCGSRAATLSMVFKLAQEAEKSWRRLRGYGLISKVVAGVVFQDGEAVEEGQKVA